MSVTNGKISNYNGQAKDNTQLNSYLIGLDRDMQNIWQVINTIARYTGINSGNLATNATLGFSYIPQMTRPPQATPTNLGGHTAVVFVTSDSSLRIYNTSDTSWKLELLT